MPPFSISETLVYEGHSAEVTSVAFSPDGKHIASGSNDQTLRVWDSDSTIPPSSPLEGHTWGVKSICFSPDGNQLVSGSADSTLRLWNANDKTAVSQPLKGHSDSVGTVAFSPNSNTIASGSNDRTIRLWDAQEAKCISEPLEGHSDWVKSVAFSPSNTWVASGSDDCTIKIWDTSSRSLVAGPLQGHTWGINSVAFSPDGLYLISGSQDHSIRIWDVRNSKLVNTPFEGHAWWVTSVAFAPNGEYIVSGSRDCTARTWDARDGTAAFESFEHTSWVNSVAFSPCSTRIVLGLEDSKVVIRNLSNNEPGHSDDEGSTEYTSEFSSEDIPVRDMFDTLLAHGCVDLSSQLVPERTSAMPIAGGGFGDIWTGYLQDGSEVAIKTWRMTAIEVDGAKPLKRAMRELYYWSKLSHENVHKLMGVIMFQDRYLGMVSQWMSRGSLRQYIRQHPQADRYSLVASGLSYLHSVKMIHGDLKAMNILVSSEGVAKLSDFDHSIMSNCSLSFSQTGSARAVGGTYRWMAPELFNGTVSTKDDKTDVYALGMTLLEIITGAVPYPKHQDAQVPALVMNRTLPTRSTKHFPDNGRDNHLWELLVRCWSHEPKDRPNAAEALEVVQFIMTLTI